MLRFFVALMLGIGLLAGPAASLAAPTRNLLPVDPDDAQALEQAARAICSRRVALLGEAAHGDARTEQFKIALIERLVERCGFRAVLFEASFYEFVALERARRAGQPVTPERLATAVGGLWRYDREFQPLLPWLAEHASSGRIQLGGLDLQQGGRGQDYANFGLLDELTAPLPAAQRDNCRAAFRDHLYKGFAAGRLPTLQSCLAAIRAQREPSDLRARGEHRAMIDMLGRFVALDQRDKAGFIAARDRAMFDLLAFWQDRLPNGTKVIIWTATVHAARDAAAAPTFAPVRNLGGWVAERYGARAYALGFGAAGGITRGYPALRAIPSAERDSLERLALAADDPRTAFLDHAALRRAGPRSAGLFNHQRIMADWSALLDGVVVFPVEVSAADVRNGS